MSVLSLGTKHYSIRSLRGLKKIAIKIRVPCIHIDEAKNAEIIVLRNSSIGYFYKILLLLTGVSQGKRGNFELFLSKKSTTDMRILTFLFVAVMAAGCGGNSSTGHVHESEGDSTDSNRALYDQVMGIHDEVMPKIGDIYELKRKLQEEITASPNMVLEKRKNLERRIANLDSVGQLMTDWMHEFNPMPDSTDQEAAREYLEQEMEKIRNVKSAMLDIIQQERGSR